MPDYTSESSSSGVDSMLGAFFGNVSQRAFGRVGKNIDGLEDKFKRLDDAAKSPFQSLRASAEKVESTFAGINKQLEEQANRIRRMPKLPRPTTGQPHPTTGQGRDPSTGRWLPGRGGRGGGGGGGRFRFGATSSGNFFAGGFGGVGGLTTLGAAFGIGSVARGYSSFDANLATLQAEAGLNQAQRKDVTGQILDIAGGVQFNTDEISSTLIAMVKDGIALTDALEQVPNVLRLAVAESTDLESAWATLRGFVQSTNSSWDESTRFMDYMSNATSLSAAKLRDLQDIASRGLTAHTSLDAFSTEGFLAIAGELKSLNISNEIIGTGMRQFGTTIARATEGGLTPNAMAALQARGIQFERGMTEVEALKEIQAGVEGMQDTELKNFFHEVFGERAKKVFENIIPKVDELEKKMELIRKKGTVNEKFEVHAKSLTNQMKLLTSAADSLIKKFVMILNESGAFGGGIGWVTEKITQLTAFMESNKDAIQSWWSNFQEILGGLFNLVATGIEKFANFWSGLNEGQKTILTIGGIILAFLANPVAGIIAAGALIIAKWQPIKSFFVTLWNDVTWETAEAWNTIKGLPEKAWNAITDITKTAWEKVKGFFSGAKSFFVDVWNAITSPARTAVSFIQDIWSSLPNKIKETLQSAFDSISEKFGDFTDKLKTPMEQFFGWIGEKFDWLKTKVIDTLNWLPGVNIGGGALIEEKKKPALPQIARIEGETPQMYKFRQMQERDRLRKLEEQDALQLRTIDETEKKQNKARDQAIKRQRRLRAGTSALGGFEAFDKYRQIAETTAVGGFKPFEEWEKKRGKTIHETRADTSATPIARQMETPEHLRPGRAFNRNFLPNFVTGVNKTLAIILQQQKDMMRQRMMAGRGFNRTSMPYLPSVTGFGDMLVKQILEQEDIQLFAEMMEADRRRAEPKPEGLFGTPKKQLPTADLSKSLGMLEATRVIRFPKLDDSQYQDLSQMFRSGFLSLVDVNSAILAEMQTQTRLLGGTVAPDMPVIRTQADAVFDDEITKRLEGIQQLTAPVIMPNYEDSAAPHVPVITPETSPALEELLENRLRLAERGDSEHGRVTATGQRVEVAGNQTTQSGGITIGKIEIHAGSDTSARDLVKQFLRELENEMRSRNFM